MTTEDELRNVLLSKPYTDIGSWHKQMEFVGDEFLVGWNERMLKAVKEELDEVLRTGVEISYKSKYDDIPDWANLDVKYWPEEEKLRYGVPINEEE